MKNEVRLEGDLSDSSDTDKGAIGKPHRGTIHIVQKWLQSGDTVSIYTHRLDYVLPDSEEYRKITESIENWCIEHVGRKLPFVHVGLKLPIQENKYVAKT